MPPNAIQTGGKEGGKERHRHRKSGRMEGDDEQLPAPTTMTLAGLMRPAAAADTRVSRPSTLGEEPGAAGAQLATRTGRTRRGRPRLFMGLTYQSFARRTGVRCWPLPPPPRGIPRYWPGTRGRRKIDRERVCAGACPGTAPWLHSWPVRAVDAVRIQKTERVCGELFRLWFGRGFCSRGSSAPWT